MKTASIILWNYGIFAEGNHTLRILRQHRAYSLLNSFFNLMKWHILTSSHIAVGLVDMVELCLLHSPEIMP